MAVKVVVKRYRADNTLIAARAVIKLPFASYGESDFNAEHTFTVPHQSGKYTIELYNPSDYYAYSKMQTNLPDLSGFDRLFDKNGKYIGVKFTFSPKDNNAYYVNVYYAQANVVKVRSNISDGWGKFGKLNVNNTTDYVTSWKGKDWSSPIALPSTTTHNIFVDVMAVTGYTIGGVDYCTYRGEILQDGQAGKRYVRTGSASSLDINVIYTANTYKCTYDKGSSTSGEPPKPQSYYVYSSITISDKNTLEKTTSSSSTSTITFHPNGGSTTKSSATLTTTTKTPYTFQGWTTTKNGTTVEHKVGDLVKFGATNVTLYPVWAKGTPSLSTKGVTVPTATECTRTGYKLLGFSTKKDATTATYKPGDSTGGNITSATTLYAVWERIYYTVTLSANPSEGGTVSGANKYAAGTEVTISATANEGYEFTKWSDNNTNASRKITLKSNINLTAYFSKIYTLSYDKSYSDAVGNVPEPQSSTTKVTLQSTDLYRPADNKVELYTITFNNPYGSNGTMNLAGNITYEMKYAFSHWTIAGKTYNAGAEYTFSSTDATAFAQYSSTASEISHAISGVACPDPGTRYGYEFSGWTDAKGVTYQIGEKYPDSTGELTAGWVELAKYTLALSVNPPGAGTVTGGGEYITGTSVTISAKANEGYAFSSWSDGVTSANRKITLSSDVTLTANFDKVVYTCTYYKGSSTGGTVPAPQSYHYDESVTIRNNGALTHDDVISSSSYTISFNANGGSTTKTSESCSITKTSKYSFMGWDTSSSATTVRYKAGQEVQFGAMSVGLYAVWAESSSSLSGNTGVTVPTAAECTRPGYKLLGFRVANSETVNYAPGASTGKDFLSDTTLYAVWDGPYYTLTYTKYDDNTGNPPDAQEFKPNVTEVTIQDKNTLAKSNTETDLKYTVTFNPNGGSTTNSSGTCTIKQTTSYQFKGWTATKNGTEVQYTAGSIYTFTQGNKIFYPVWIGTTTSSANIGVTLPTEDECTRPGYRLLGFSSSANATTADYKPGGSTGSAYYSNTTLYAVWERIKYKVYFRKDTKENYDSVIVTHPDVYAIIASGEKFTLPSNGHVTKEPETVSSSRIEFKPANGDDSIYKDYSSIKSYTQNGWAYYNTSTTVAAGASVIIEKDTDFMAWWSSRTDNTSIKTPAAPTRVGYTFKGWKLDGTSHIYGAETNYTPGDVSGVAENTSFTAQWEINIYTVTLSVSPEGAGSVSGDGKYDAGSTVRISASAASGYKFSKWSDDDTNSIRDIVLNNDISLTAYFEKIYYVYFHKDNTEEYPSYITVAPNAHTWVYSGGSFTLPGNIVSKAQIDNGPYTVIFVPTNGESNITSSYYNHTKYTQNGWAYYNTTTWLSASDTINDIRSNLTFQAYWKTENWNDTITTPSTAPTKEGYTFKGWLADDGVTYGSGARYTPTGTGQKQLTAQWEAKEYTYNIVYKSSSGVELGTSTITGKFDSSTQVFPKSFTGYTSPGPQTVTFDSTTAKTITFTYTPINYTITWELNEGSWPSGVTPRTKYTIESDAYIFPTPARDHYKFKGWYDNPDFTGSAITILDKNSTGNRIYYAKWEITYYIYFYKDTTETYPSNIKVAPDVHTWVYHGESFTLPGNVVSKAQIDNSYLVIFVPTNGESNITSSYYNHTKYTQNGWAYYNTNIRVAAGETINDIRNDLSFQAYWKSENWNDPVKTPSTEPLKTGYTFKGWLADDGVTYGINTNYTPAGTGQKQLTAQWTANEYTYNVVYKSSSGKDLGSTTVTKTFDTTNTITAPAKNGYTTPEPQSIKWDSTTAKTITFIYTPIEYTITWVLNDGNWGDITPRTKYTIESERYVFETPVREHYIFDGWYDNQSFTGLPTAALNKGVIGDRTYYAKWEAKEYTYNIVYRSNTGVQLETSTITGKYGSSTQVSPKSFKGYTSPGAQTVKFDSASKTITFVYAPIEYTITWVLNGGSWPSGVTPRKSFTIESGRYELPTPIRANYTFGGWYDNANFTGSAVTVMVEGSYNNRTYYAKWLATFTLRAIRDNVCNVSVTYGSSTSSSGGDTSYAELSIVDQSSPIFTIRAFGGMGGAYDFDRWEYESSFSHVTFGNKNSKETTAQISSAINGRYLAYVYAYTKKVAYFKIKLGEHVKSCKISYTSYWENTQKEVTQTAKEITYYAVEGTPFSIDKSSIVADYGYVATSGFGGNPGYTDDTLSNVKTITVSKAARYSLSALTNANGTFKGDVMITNDDGATARTFGTIETITVAEQISSKFKIQALPTNPSYYFSHWTRAAGTDFTYIDNTKNTDRDARIQFTGTNIETVYGLAMQANFNKWPSVKIGCRVSDSLSNPVLNGQYGVGDIKINYTNGPSYASNGEYIGDSKYEIKGYDIAGRGWVSRPGEYLKLEAIPADNYEFSKWILFGSSEDTYVTQSIDFQVPFVNCVLYAIFKPIKRDIYIKSNSTIAYNKPGKFYICKGTFDPNLYSYDTSIKILNNVDTFTLVAPIDPAVGYEFDGWYRGSGIKLKHHVLSGCAYVTLMPGEDAYSSNTFIAKYSLKEFTLSTHTRAEILGTTATGTISPSYPDGTTVEYGKSISFTAKPALEPRSKFSKWMLQRSFGDELELGTDPSLTYIHNYLCDTMLTAVFSLANILNAHVHVSKVDRGTIDIIHKSGADVYTYKDQTDKTFQCFETDALVLTAKPKKGYKFLYWRYNDVTGRLKETYDSILNLSLIDRNSTLTCIAFFEEINYSFYFKQQGGDDKCITAITIGSNMYTPQKGPIEFTVPSIEGKKVRLVSQVKDGSEYVFKEWRITNSDGKTTTITSSTYDIENLLAYGETFTILAVYWRASQGNLTVRVVSGSSMAPSVSDGPGNYPSEYTTAQQWYDTGDNYLYYLSQSELSNPAVFGECTWYVNGRTAQMRGGAEGSWAPTGTQSWPNANKWLSVVRDPEYTGNWFESDTPQVGSVAVFKKYMSGYGHVGVVEAINSDETLTISQFNGVDPEHYHTALAPLTRANPSNFIFINNTVNKVIGESDYESNNSGDTIKETTVPGSAVNIGGESWIDYNSQQYKIVTTYFTGDTCTLVAIPNSGFAFDYWQDPHGTIIYGEENSTYSFTVTEDTAGTYLAYFRRTEVGPGGEEPEKPYDPEDPSIPSTGYKYYAYSAVQSYIQQRGQAYWNYKKNKWLVGYGPFLTSKFIKLEYIESNKASQQWMSLGWKPSPLTILEFTGQFTDISGDQVIGSRYCGVHVQDGSMWFECGSSTQPIEFDTEIHTFKINCGTGECYLDNVLYSCAKLDRVAKSPIKLFGLDNEDFAGNKVALDPYSSSFRLYSAKIWDINPNSPNMLVRDLIPVRRWHREEDPVLYIGLWDKVFNRFYQSNAYMTIDGEYTQINLIPGPDVIENNEPKVLEKTYR